MQPAVQGIGFWHWGNNHDLRGYTAAYKGNKEGFVFFANSENTFALAEPLAKLITDEPQWGMNWLHFERERYDNPLRTAHRGMEKAFLEQGAQAGLRKLAEARERFPEHFDAADLVRTGRYLIDRNKPAEAAALLEHTVKLAPKRVQAWEQLGLAEMERKRFSKAEAAFQKALEIRPKQPLSKIGIPWVRELAAVWKRPIVIPERRLRAYAGDYGPRRITLREGSLYYQREGQIEFRLRPLSRNTFYLEDNLSFRLRFADPEGGKAAELTGLYIEGRSDSNQRSGSNRI